MAKKFKEYYGQEVAKVLADKIIKVQPSFDSKAFIDYIVNNTIDIEMSERLDVVVEAFELYISSNCSDCFTVFEQIWGEKLTQSTGMFREGWWLWPIGRYIEKHCLENIERSYVMIYELTQRFTGEFAIRPLLQMYPEKSLDVLIGWSCDSSVHVRRLSSEGIRIRLPWARKLQIYSAYPKHYFQIWNTLKSDPEKCVRKSVANGINDLLKEDKQAGLDILDIWFHDNPTLETQWVIRHSLRWLRKQNDSQAFFFIEKMQVRR